jgi:hypothetical protein
MIAITTNNSINVKPLRFPGGVISRFVSVRMRLWCDGLAQEQATLKAHLNSKQELHMKELGGFRW